MADPDVVKVALGGTPDGAAKRVLKVVLESNDVDMKLTEFKIVTEDGMKTAVLTFE